MAYTPENNPYIPGDPYSYDLKWIVDKLKEAINLYQPLNDKFDNLSDEFDDLKNYVNTYFDELDLTAEVQAIIEQMRASGFFDQLISEIVTSSGTIESTTTAWLQANVNPVGSAVVVDASLSISGAAADAKVVGDTFKNTALSKIIDFSGGQTNKFISASGIVYDQNNYTITAPVAIPKGYTVKIRAYGYSPNTCILADYDSTAQTYTPLITSTASAVTDYTYITTRDINAVICCNITFEHSAYFYIDLSSFGDLSTQSEETAESLSSVVKVLEDGGNYAQADLTNVVRDQFIHTNNVIAASTDFCYTQPVYVKRGSLITAIMRGYSTQVSIITEYDPITDSYKSLVGSIDNTVRTYQYITTHDCYICFSYNYHFTHEAYIGDYKGLYNAGSLALFKKIAVVSDSFATGTLYFNNTYTEKYDISWPAIMERENGIDVDNFSKGGLSTRTWLTDPAGLAAMNAATAADLYIIALGINDYSSLGINYLGTQADIESHADTFYGNLSTIIDSILAHAPNAKIVLSTMANTNSIPEQFNEAIINTAIAKGLPYIIQADCKFFSNPVYKNMRGSHPTAPAYAGMAEAFKDMIIDAMYKFPSYFITTYMYN